eukprot:scaffold7424_cov417-Prasinococcus_capsulatus_cf.AAC.3
MRRRPLGGLRVSARDAVVIAQALLPQYLHAQRLDGQREVLRKHRLEGTVAVLLAVHHSQGGHVVRLLEAERVGKSGKAMAVGAAMHRPLLGAAALREGDLRPAPKAVDGVPHARVPLVLPGWQQLGPLTHHQLCAAVLANEVRNVKSALILARLVATQAAAPRRHELSQGPPTRRI